MKTWARHRAAALALAACVALPGVAGATGLESPSIGVMQMGRGGAWLARADDPLAAYFNPAAMAWQPHGVHLGAHVMFRSHCFDRRGVDGQPVSPGQGLAPPPGEVCADIPPLPNPQLAGVFRLHRQVALGLAVTAPHGSGSSEWPETISYPEGNFGNTDHPSPQRYLLLKNQAIALFPTLSVAYAPLPNLSFGAGFVWGIASLEFANMNEAVSPVRGTPQPDDFVNDIRAQLSGFDGIVPGFVVSAMYSPSRRVDIAAWYRWSDAIRTRLDVMTQAGYYKRSGQVDDVASNDPANITSANDAGRFELAIPMEARLGVRYRHPRAGARPQGWADPRRWGRDSVRDSMASDVFDIEVDVTWAHNSQVDSLVLRFDPGIPIAGTPGTLPENGDIPHEWRDVIGVRLGGDYNVIPDLFALRLGGFFESKGVEDSHLNVDFHLAERGGVAAGATLRLSRFDISLAYQHTFFGALDNGGNGAVRGISGDVSTGDQRTRQTVNGGRATSSLDEIALGATAHF